MLGLVPLLHRKLPFEMFDPSIPFCLRSLFQTQTCPVAFLPYFLYVGCWQLQLAWERYVHLCGCVPLRLPTNETTLVSTLKTSTNHSFDAPRCAAGPSGGSGLRLVSGSHPVRQNDAGSVTLLGVVGSLALDGQHRHGVAPFDSVPLVLFTLQRTAIPYAITHSTTTVPPPRSNDLSNRIAYYASSYPQHSNHPSYSFTYPTIP